MAPFQAGFNTSKEEDAAWERYWECVSKNKKLKNRVLPKIKPRRRHVNNDLKTHLESDIAFVKNNLRACIWFLEHHAKLTFK